MQKWIWGGGAALVLASMATAQGGFPARVFPSDAGEAADVIGAADFDHDGVVDVLTGSQGAVLFRGDGVGGFNAGVSLTGASFLPARALVDFDGDGWLDLFGVQPPFFGWPAGPPAPGALRIAYGDSNGGVLAAIDIASGDFTWVDAADFNSDGRPDLVALDSTRDEFHLLLGQPGGFAPDRVVPAGANVQADPAIGDFDGDGALDLAFLQPEFAGPPFSYALRSTVVVHGDGAGAFAGRYFVATPFAERIYAADVDGDGASELVAYAFPFSTQRLEVYRHLGGGAFSRQLAPGRLAPPLHFADVDGDGDVDLLAMGRFGRELRRNDGAGGFAAREELWSSFDPTGIGAADVNGDGYLDLLSPQSSGDLCVTYSNSQAGYDGPVTAPFARNVGQVLAGDLDNDGVQDFLTFLTGRFETHHGLGGGAFEQRSRVGIGGLYEQAQLLDVDGDGDLDLAALHGGSPRRVVTHRNDGLGQFDPLARETAVADALTYFADCDGDGRGDVVQIGATIEVRRGDGLGGFLAPTSTPYVGDIGTPQLADVNGDGRADLIASAQPFAGSNHAVQVYFGASNGGFLAGSLQLAPTHERIVATGDFDGDGRVDLVGWDGGGAQLWVGLGDGVGGFGAFAATPYVSTFPSGPEVIVARFDLDALDDVALLEQPWASVTSNELRVLHSLGGGAFAPAEQVLIPPYSSRLRAFDSDADGRAELLVQHPWTLRTLFLGER